MEEKNIKDGAQGKKLTYEQLEAYAQQTTSQNPFDFKIPHYHFPLFSNI